MKSDIDEAIDAVIKAEGIDPSKIVRMGRGNPTSWRISLSQYIHWLGIHTRFQTSSYNPKTGEYRYVGLKCLWCDDTVA